MNSAFSTSAPLYSRLAADPEMQEIIDLFVAEMPERVTSLLARLEAADWESLRCLAHQLKGAAGSYGFPALSPAAGELEEAIRTQQPEEQIRRAVETLIDLCRRARGGTPT